MKPSFSLIPALCLVAMGAPLHAGEAIDFNRDIRPILSGKCFACHGPDEEERGGDLRLDTQDGSRRDLGGYAAIVPGKADDSEMIYRITTDDEIDLMPPPDKGARLTKEEVALLKRWIDGGGDYAMHWAYRKPERPEIPESVRKDWKRNNAIDAFIHRRLESEGLAPSPEADRLTLARRVALDLTGLPPTWDEARQFAKDESPEAFDRFVEAQLNKPAFGERWAAVWLDLARYADSAGYADDPARTIWAYRDWVIRAFNRNQPFDQFTIDQIAGDLVDEPTSDQLVATAFHRNTPTNNEGGTNDEEFRNVAVVDRVNTTFEVWMGTTMACAQCHTHKYDPITQAEYFQIFDYFNQSADSDKRDERPLHEIWTDELLEKKQSFTSRISELERVLAEETPALRASREAWLATLREEPKWDILAPGEATATGTNLKALDAEAEGWIAQDGKRPDRSGYRLTFPTGKGKVTGLRLEVGEEQKSRFQLSQVTATWKPAQPTPIEGRFVRVELKGKGKMIHLAEVEVFSEGENLAPKAKATQSSTGFNGPPELAIDGNTDGVYTKGSVSHTAVETDPWFEIDLGAVRSLDRVVLWGRTDQGTVDRLKGYQVRILDQDRNPVWEQHPEGVPAPSTALSLSGERSLRFQAALSESEPDGFPAASVIAATIDPKKGWTNGKATGKPHRLTLVLDEPLDLGEGELVVHLNHRSGSKGQLLSHFRLAATGNPNLSAWGPVPETVRQAIRKEQPTPKDLETIATHHRSIAKELAPQRQELAKVKKSLEGLKPVTVPIMTDLAAGEERETHIQIRGNYKNRGDKVTRGTPAVFHPVRDDLPANRLALAEWLVDPENPLTARVIVNRFWEQIFGTGIVATSEEFGSQGELPSHPELLDWLAVEFQSTGWDVKELLRLMVSSATYRQVSEMNPELEEKDPFNRYYARGPRFRIPAETIRDQALFAGGLLSDKQFGPPVKPPQPDLGLKAAFGSQTDWKASEGEDRYRRGVYTSWRRSSPYPSMAAFDAPNREVCTSRRIRTNTPLQALVTLNDPVYIEAAQALARRMITEGGDTLEDRLRHGWRTTLVREPRPEELARLVALFEESRADFASRPEEAKTFATDPLGPLPEGGDAAELASLTLVGNVILNLDELFLKR